MEKLLNSPFNKLFRTFHIPLAIIALWGITALTWASSQFIATVDTHQIVLGETFTLSLEFSGDAPQGTPDTSPLEDLFDIERQQQSQQLSIQGSTQESKTIWQYILSPKKTGNLTIPPITLQTAAGSLTTQAISIIVMTHPSGQRKDHTRLESIVSNPKPYLHQPVIYTLRLYHRGDLRELQPLPPQEGVIIEQLGQLNNRRQIVQGQELFVSEINYLLTPLRSGRLDLGTARMKALKMNPRNNTFGNSFFSFNLDSHPVTLSTDTPLKLEVQAPVHQPWLPLKNLTLKQKWDQDVTQSVLVGVPLILTLTLVAEEMGGQPLLSLENFMQLPHTEFRIRSPKPEIERKLLPDGKTPGTQALQTFSITPLKTGTLHLPAVRIPWWNTQKNSLAWAELPAQTLSVIPNQATYTPKLEEPLSKLVTSSPPVFVTQYTSLSPAQYVFLTLSLIALFIALWQSYSSHRLAALPHQENKSLSLSTFKKRLQQTQDMLVIKQLIQEYAHSHWHLPQHASLHHIAHYLNEHYEEGEAYHRLFKELDAALYGHHEIFLEGWKKKLEVKISYLKEKKRTQRAQHVQGTTFSPLNPSMK